jgi:hypothetical protein
MIVEWRKDKSGCSIQELSWMNSVAVPITVAARYKAWTVFARSNTVVMGLNPTWGMDDCVRLFCV